jgi:hypothetical protein
MYPLFKKSYKIKSMKIAIQYTYILRHKIALLELKLADMATHDCENDK